MIVAVVVHCPSCFTERRVPSAGVQEARRRLKASKWEQRRLNDVWADLCPRCLALTYGEAL